MNVTQLKLLTEASKRLDLGLNAIVSPTVDASLGKKVAIAHFTTANDSVLAAFAVGPIEAVREAPALIQDALHQMHEVQYTPTEALAQIGKAQALLTIGLANT
jgi:hypothetical protein